jgi:hypothetical protein
MHKINDREQSPNRNETKPMYALRPTRNKQSLKSKIGGVQKMMQHYREAPITLPTPPWEAEAK